jgi:hypothetical protein
LSLNNPFAWKSNPRPSIFSADQAFTGYRTTGKTKSQTMAEVVERKTAATGRNPGTIANLGARTVARVGFTNPSRKKRG